MVSGSTGAVTSSGRRNTAGASTGRFWLSARTTGTSEYQFSGEKRRDVEHRWKERSGQVYDVKPDLWFPDTDRRTYDLSWSGYEELEHQRTGREDWVCDAEPESDDLETNDF